MSPKTKDEVSENNQNVDEFFRQKVGISFNDLKASAKGRNNERSNEDVLSDNIIDNSNKYFLIKILSPQVEENEKKKRTHKDDLIKIIKVFLLIQFSVVAILTIGIISMIFAFHWMKNDISIDYIDMIIKFVSVYITSVVVELIAMLRYVVQNVFDTSIAELVKLYKETTSNDEDNKS